MDRLASDQGDTLEGEELQAGEDTHADTADFVTEPVEEDPDSETLVGEPGGYRFSRRIAVLADPTGTESSAVGALRNHLSQQHIGIGRRSLAICSIGDEVQRSLVSVNLAVAAAQAGLSTVLIDANMREPELETYFQPPEVQPGLSDYLAGTLDDPAQVIREDVLPNLSLIHAGERPADPQALLSSRRFEDLVTGLMRSFDFTIVDCPAARYSSDTRRLASVLRYALLVVKRDVTYVADVKHFIEELTSDRVTIVGTFLDVD
ncbi:CpsD/CapB family tyrosine-protein kinase [Qipengyuania sp.]|uniref:CpsD/CapB family tyrosine-protein kinase n=1 Tax=Qipengyuania sp. TaxID=2004515 RepID=UPI0035C80B9D